MQAIHYKAKPSTISQQEHMTQLKAFGYYYKNTVLMKSSTNLLSFWGY